MGFTVFGNDETSRALEFADYFIIASNDLRLSSHIPKQILDTVLVL